MTPAERVAVFGGLVAFVLVAPYSPTTAFLTLLAGPVAIELHAERTAHRLSRGGLSAAEAHANERQR